MGERSQTPDIHHILVQIIDRAAKAIPFERALVSLYTRGSQSMVWFCYALQGGIHLAGDASAAADDIVRQVLTSRRPARLEADDSRVYIAAPLHDGDRFLGVLSLQGAPAKLPPEAHLQVLSALADQAAIALGYVMSLELAQSELTQVEVFRRITRLMTSTLDPDALLARVAEETTALVGVKDVLFFLPDREEQHLLVHERSVLGTPFSDAPPRFPLDADNPFSRVFTQCEALLVDDVDRIHDLPPGVTMKAALLVPLLARGQCLGIFAAANPPGGTFTAADRQALGMIADQLAIAMQNARFYAAERRRAEMMALINQIGQHIAARLDYGELMRTIVDRVHDTLDYDGVYLFLVEGDEFVIKACATRVHDPGLVEGRYRFSIEKGVSGRALRTGAAQLVNDVTKDPDYFPLPHAQGRYRAYLTVPLRFDEQALGILKVASTRLYAFDSIDREAMETLATHAAVVIHNATRYTRIQTRRRRAERLQQAGQSISRQLQLQALHKVIVEEAALAFEVPATSIMLYDEISNTLAGKAAYGLSEEYFRQRRVQVDQLEEWDRRGVSKPIYYPDLARVAGDQADLVRQEGLSSMVAVPLHKGGRYLGSLNFYGREQPLAFGVDDVELAQLLANQVAVALENARLFEALEVHAQELAQANRLKSEFLANISHELRTPMNAILGFSEAIYNGLYGEVTEKQSTRLESVIRNARQLLKLIDDLLDISKIEAGNLQLAYERVDFTGVVQHVVGQYRTPAENKGLSLQVMIADVLPAVRGDVARLSQILDNLLSNAIKFTQEGRVDVRVDVHQQHGRAWVRCRVQDTGIGIAPHNQAVIFNAFRQVDGSSTRQYGGSGLGLALTKHLVEMMGGRIRLESALGQGSLFTFRLPAEL